MGNCRMHERGQQPEQLLSGIPYLELHPRYILHPHSDGYHHNRYGPGYDRLETRLWNDSRSGLRYPLHPDCGFHP